MAKRIVARLTLILALIIPSPAVLAFPTVFTGTFYKAPLVHGPPLALLKVYSPESFVNPGDYETTFLISRRPPGNEFLRLASLDLPGPAVPPLKITPLFTSVPPAPKSAQCRPRSNLPKRVLDYARKFLHIPYRAGGSLQTGRATDCSGFVQHIYRNFHVNLPHSSREQARRGRLAARKMDFSKLRPGDLLFFRRRDLGIGHVGLYLGQGKMIHASSHRRGVIISDLHQSYYQHTFVMAKRLLGSLAE